MRIISLAIALFVFWFLLSGHTGAWFLGSGVVVAGLVALFGRSFGYADEEGHPAELIPPGFLYWPWLVMDIFKMAFRVSRIILSPSLPVTPKLIELWPTQKSTVGVVTYANSIALTPGSVTARIDHRHRRFVVHALTEAIAAELQGGEMDRRVTAFERKL